MDFYTILLPLALILALSKILVKVLEHLHIPSVVGMLFCGVLLGVIRYIPGQELLSNTALEGIGFIAKIGVILIMFSAGLTTDIKQIKAIGAPAAFITLAGVIVPMGLGFLVALVCNGHLTSASTHDIISDLFYGVILTATSVSVTVATLKELGKLNGKLGSTIVAAAILDDIIGVVVLSLLSGLSTDGGSMLNTVTVIIKTVLFFIVAVVFGLLISKLFDFIEKHWPHHRMLPVLSLSMCFLFAYASEAIFGVADITGAFVAGLILSHNPERAYIDRRSDIVSYMIFMPVFFANIGITTQFTTINPSFILLGVLFVLAGMVGKFCGCSLTAKLCGYTGADCVRIGIGMMVRAEVALVCTQKGCELGLIDPAIMPFVVLLIVITSFATPVIMRLSYRKELKEEQAHESDSHLLTDGQ